MYSVQIIDSVRTTPVSVAESLALHVKRVAASVQAGFPSPAEDHALERIDLNKVLIQHPEATYLLRVRGESMREAGIDDGDVVLVDRALKPGHGDVVVAVLDGDFTVKRLHSKRGRIKLLAANCAYPDIEPREGQTLEVWGVVTSTIKQMRR